MYRIAAFCTAILLLTLPAYGEEPALPLGLEEENTAGSSEPDLPLGLGEENLETFTNEKPDTDSLPFSYRGFLESRGGVRVFNDPTEKDASIGEARLQTQFDRSFDWFSARVTSDLVADPVANDWPVDLESGDGFLDLREAYLFFRLGEYADFKMGRQILTWGTGDFLFINDLFPKDWNSFFIGRDDEYLKAPSDAARLSLFSDFANLELVYSPSFDSDRFIDGRRVSFFSPLASEITGRNMPLQTESRNEWFEDDELSARLYRRVESYELALYGYHGFWKSPGGFEPSSQKGTFPRLSVYGASVRGPVLSGIGNLETGYYDSRDDRSGDNVLVRNSEVRFLAGYEREIVRDLTGGLQYYVEKMVDYDDYRSTLPSSALPQDEYRQLITLRLTQFLMSQNLRLSFFTFYSPTDKDAYPRASANYKVNDAWQVEAGTNFFFGDDKRSFFAQFEDNSNVYAALRYSFAGGRE